MREDSSLAYDLESLKIAAREARQDRSESQVINQHYNRTDIVHAGFRILQCTAAAMIFLFHLVDTPHHLHGFWDYAFIIIYPFCFVSSLVLAITRILNVVPNPKPVIPVIISGTGWALMLTGAILSMRHANEELNIEELSDQDLAADHTFRHDLLLCGLSLVGSSLYLVHAWICYDCWLWDKKQKALRAAVQAVPTSDFTSASESDSGMSSNVATEPQDDALALPGTSGARDKSPESGHRKSKLLRKHRRPPETKPPEPIDPLATLNDILRDTVQDKQDVRFLSFLIQCQNGCLFVCSSRKK